MTQERESPEWHARLHVPPTLPPPCGTDGRRCDGSPSGTASAQRPGLIQPVALPPARPVHDTFNGLLAFVVPGSDTYSKHQGVSTAEAGGVDAGITDVLIASMDQAVPFRSNFSVELAGILNGVAVVNTSASGPFSAPFAKLSFPEKVKVFAFLEGGVVPELRLPPRRCPAPVRRFLGLLGGRGLRPGYAR